MVTIIEENQNAIVIALSDTEVGKVILPNNLVWVNAKTGEPVDLFGKEEEPSFEKETQALQYANTINNLFPTFIRNDVWQTEDGKIHQMIVMERLYILPTHHFDLETRKIMVSDFVVSMKELHDKFFVHGDFCRPTNYFTRGNFEWMFKNIVQTEKGLRLIDTGFSKYLAREKNTRMLASCLVEERQDINLFRYYYLEEEKESK